MSCSVSLGGVVVTAAEKTKVLGYPLKNIRKTTVVLAQMKFPTVDPVFNSEVLLAWEIIGRELILCSKG